MSRRWRTPRYGAAVGVTLAGIACGATIPGTLGGTLATVLIGIGLVGIVSLLFYEVGISEDRDRTRTSSGRLEDRARSSTSRPESGSRSRGEPSSTSPAEHPRPAGERRVRPRRFDRSRGEHRRLR